MVHTIQWRVGSDAALDFWESRLAGETRARRARRRRRGLRGSRGPAAPARRVDGRRCPARRGAPGYPGRARPPGFRRGARIHGIARARAESCSRRPRLRRTETAPGRRAARPAAACMPTTSHPQSAASAAPAPCTTSPGRSPLDEQEAWHERVAHAGNAPVADHRPLLVPLDLLPRAERRPLRARDARPGLLGRRGSRPPRRVARPPARLRAPPLAGRAVLTPIPDPRPWARTG